MSSVPATRAESAARDGDGDPAQPAECRRSATADAMYAWLEEVAQTHQAGEAPSIRTGLDDLDLMTGGFERGTVTVIAGRPQMGKTSLALRTAVHAAQSQRKPTAVFSYESAPDAICCRVVSTEARVDSKRARTGKLRDDEFVALGRSAGVLSTAPIHIESPATLSFESLELQIRALAENVGLELVVIDCLQLIDTPFAESRHQGVSAISRRLKRLAIECRLSVIIVSQCSRGPEQRGADRRPRLTDLRDSGAIEDDADLVLFVYRQEVYDEADGIDPTQPNRGDPPSAGRAEIIVAKQRNGPTGIVQVVFERRFARFDNVNAR